MEIMSASQARKEIFHIVKERKFVEIQHKSGAMVLLPKEALSEQKQYELACEDVCAKWGEHVPNEETLAAMNEKSEDCERFESTEELFKSMGV